MDDWRTHAACRQIDPDVFFPYQEGRVQVTAPAMRYCDTCPVRLLCLEEALLDPSLSGVWGATTTEERDEIRRKAMIGLPRKYSKVFRHRGWHRHKEGLASSFHTTTRQDEL